MFDNLIAGLDNRYGANKSAWALGQIRDVSAIDPLIRHISITSGSGNQNTGDGGAYPAVDALANIGSPAAVEPLLGIFCRATSGFQNDIFAAYLTLKKLGLPVLAKALGDNESADRLNQILKNINPYDEYKSKTMYKELRLIYNSFFLKELKNSNPSIRRKALSKLHFSYNDRNSVEFANNLELLISFLNDPSEEVRQTAEERLGIEAGLSQIVSISRLLNNWNESRHNCMSIIVKNIIIRNFTNGTWGKDGIKSMKRFLEVLNAPECSSLDARKVISHAFEEAFKEIYTKSRWKLSVHVLLYVLHAPIQEIREYAEAKLHTIDVSAIKELTEASQDSDEQVCKSAVVLLARLKAWPSLVQILKSSTSEYRSVIIEGLVEAKAVIPLIEGLCNSSKEVKQDCINALLKIDDWRAKVAVKYPWTAGFLKFF